MLTEKIVDNITYVYIPLNRNYKINVEQEIIVDDYNYTWKNRCGYLSSGKPIAANLLVPIIPFPPSPNAKPYPTRKKPKPPEENEKLIFQV